MKTRLRNHLGDETLDMLMKMCIEGPKTLEDEKLYRRHMETKTKMKISCLNYCYYGKGLGGGGEVHWFGAEASSAPPLD